MKYYFPLLVLFVASILRVYLFCSNKGLIAQCNSQSKTEESPILAIFSKVRSSSIDMVYKIFPSPHAELLLGMVIGVDRIGDIPSFESALKRSGTTHVVVVSGFNISLVFGLVVKSLGSRYKLRNVVIAQIVTFLYSLLTGFQPPVVRAWVMGSVMAWGKYYGRAIDGLRVLIFSALVMILVSPLIVFSLSFQLSFTACLGLVCVSGIFQKFRLPEDLSTTLSAQVFVWPLISHYFGTVSLISLVVNPLILWTVPISTVLGGLFLFVGVFSLGLAKLVALSVYPFLNFFVEAVYKSGNFKFAGFPYKMSLPALVMYYILVSFALLLISRAMKTSYGPKKD